MNENTKQYKYNEHDTLTHEEREAMLKLGRFYEPDFQLNTGSETPFPIKTSKELQGAQFTLYKKREIAYYMLVLGISGMSLDRLLSGLV